MAGRRKPAAVVGQADMWSTARPERPIPVPHAPTAPVIIERTPVPEGTTLWRRWTETATQLVYVPERPCAAACTLHEAVGMGCTHCGRGYWLNLTCVRDKAAAQRAHAHVAAKPWATQAVLDALWAVLQDSPALRVRKNQRD
jgi:hypothetical protein